MATTRTTVCTCTLLFLCIALCCTLSPSSISYYFLILILFIYLFFSLPCLFSSIIQSTTVWKAVGHSLPFISFFSTYLYPINVCYNIHIIHIYIFLHLYCLKLQGWIKLMKTRELTKQRNATTFFFYSWKYFSEYFPCNPSIVPLCNVLSLKD